MYRYFSIPFAFVSLLFFNSCEDNTSQSNHGEAIVLGDPSTIVIEEDSQYLENIVLDLQHREIIELPEAEMPKTTEDGMIDTVVLEDGIEEVERVFSGRTPDGFIIDFGDFKMTISGIETKEFLKQEPKKMDGVSYLITEGNIEESKIYIEGAKSVAVRQRYQSVLSLKNDKEVLVLNQQGKYSSSWESLDNQGQTNQRFEHNIVLPGKVEFAKLNANAIRNAVQKEVNARRFSRAKANQWLNLARKSSNLNKAPYQVKLHSLQWQVSGTNMKGENFFKTINLEIGN